jgi:hypothetical protein
MTKPATRLESRTFDITLGATSERPGGHAVVLALMYNDLGHVREMMFVGRGKIGQGMDDMLSELGIKCSRALQKRDPDTGDELG